MKKKEKRKRKRKGPVFNNGGREEENKKENEEETATTLKTGNGQDRIMCPTEMKKEKKKETDVGHMSLILA